MELGSWQREWWVSILNLTQLETEENSTEAGTVKHSNQASRTYKHWCYKMLQPKFIPVLRGGCVARAVRSQSLTSLWPEKRRETAAGSFLCPQPVWSVETDYKANPQTEGRDLGAKQKQKGINLFCLQCQVENKGVNPGHFPPPFQNSAPPLLPTLAVSPEVTAAVSVRLRRRISTNREDVRIRKMRKYSS